MQSPSSVSGQPSISQQPPSSVSGQPSISQQPPSSVSGQPLSNQQPPSSVSGFHQSRFSTTFSRACVSKDLRRLFIYQRSSPVSAFDTYWPSPVNNLCQSLAFVFLSLRQSWSSFINQWISSIIGFQQPSSLIGLRHSLNFISW